MNLKTLKVANRLITTSLCLVITMAVMSCSSSRMGTYSSESDGKDYFELKSDGTFLAQVGREVTNGKYEIKGDTIIFKAGVEGNIMEREAKIEGNTLIQKNGSRWTKK